MSQSCSKWAVAGSCYYSSVVIIFSRREAFQADSSPYKVPPVCLLSPAPQVLAGLLHLGNVRFADCEDEAQPCQLMDDARGESKGGRGCASGFGHRPREQGWSCPEKSQHRWDWVGGQRVKFGIYALD